MDLQVLDRCPPSFVDRVAPTDDCWIWIGVINRTGYGTYSVPGERGPRRTQWAHRFAYEQMVSPIPQGLSIDHLCRVTTCVRPDHLEAVSIAENIRRAAAAITHCSQGHEFTPENTSWRRYGRRCRTCHREGERARRQRVKSPDCAIEAFHAFGDSEALR